jgi:glutamine amidotransferase
MNLKADVITIIDYGAGNLTSVELAFAGLGLETRTTGQPEDIMVARRIVFPGVGAAGAAMAHLNQSHLTEVIRKKIAQGVPFLGICLGMQILLDSSEEDGGTPCLGIIPGQVRRFVPSNVKDKVPHMGWNNASFTSPHPLFAGIENESEFYFVHSYYAIPTRSNHVLGQTSHAGVTFASIMGRGNLIAVQFHPEKSGRIGLRLLENFSRWSGKC